MFFSHEYVHLFPPPPPPPSKYYRNNQVSLAKGISGELFCVQCSHFSQRDVLSCTLELRVDWVQRVVKGRDGSVVKALNSDLGDTAYAYTVHSRAPPRKHLLHPSVYLKCEAVKLPWGCSQRCRRQRLRMAVGKDLTTSSSPTPYFPDLAHANQKWAGTECFLLAAP